MDPHSKDITTHKQTRDSSNQVLLVNNLRTIRDSANKNGPTQLGITNTTNRHGTVSASFWWVSEELKNLRQGWILHTMKIHTDRELLSLASIWIVNTTSWEWVSEYNKLREGKVIEVESADATRSQMGLVLDRKVRWRLLQGWIRDHRQRELSKS